MNEEIDLGTLNITANISDGIDVTNTNVAGPEGAKGPKGDKGDTGDTGAPFTYDMFTEEQLADLRGPKGDKGDQGVQGPRGEQEPKGEKGDIGKTYGTSWGHYHEIKKGATE